MTHAPNPISPTALLVAQRRAYSDIPFAAESAAVLAELYQAQGTPLPSDELIRPDLAPRVEARYKLTDQLLRRAGVTQVLELAAGFSTRGLTLTSEPRFHYVELDLPEVIAPKRTVAARLVGAAALAARHNLHMVKGSVLDEAAVKAAADLLPHTEPIAIICEGLLRYLTEQQKTALCRTIHAILLERGGVWITPDIAPRSAGGYQEGDGLASHAKNIAGLSGTDFENNRFETVEAGQAFFARQGFQAQPHLFNAVADQLTSPARLGLSETQVTQAIMPGVAFVMRPTA